MGRLKIVVLLSIFLLVVLFVYKENSISISNGLTTTYNSDYKSKMLEMSKPIQETPWGFQEISLKNKVEHNVSSIEGYKKLITINTKDNKWLDDKIHIIYFSKGTYTIPLGKSYSILLVPSQTIIEGEGMGQTIFEAVAEIDKDDKFHFRKLFNLEYATHDVVVRGISFYNKTKDNKWGLFHANGGRDRENYLFENIEFDDVFGAIGKRSHSSNFITFRGLKKRIGNTTNRIKKNFKIPVPVSYQFYSLNKDNVELSGQIGIRKGHSIVFHDCLLGDNISATLDIYSNYVEVVGVNFINPLHDHSIKAPSGNHLYIHDSIFELRYAKKLIEGSGYWNPTFFTHEVTEEKEISLRKNYHLKNLKFIREYKNISAIKNKNKTIYIESEPFTIYDEAAKRKNNVSGDMVWENISFEGYSKEHQIVGYPNVQTQEGYEALNYTMYLSKPAQMKVNKNNVYGTYSVYIQEKDNSSKKDITGVYSWGSKEDGLIDFPRDNRLFVGEKTFSKNKPYVLMKKSTSREKYLILLNNY